MRKIPAELPGRRIDLFGVEAEVVGVGQGCLEELDRLGRLPHGGQGFHEPEGTEDERPLRRVVAPIAIDEPVNSQLPPQQFNGREDALVLDREELAGREEKACVEGVAPVALGERAPTWVPALLEDLWRDTTP